MTNGQGDEHIASSSILVCLLFNDLRSGFGESQPAQVWNGLAGWESRGKVWAGEITIIIIIITSNIITIIIIITRP